MQTPQMRSSSNAPVDPTSNPAALTLKTGVVHPGAAAGSTFPLAIEMDAAWWQGQLDLVEHWLGNMHTVQGAFAKLAEDVADKLKEPHLKEFVSEIATRAHQHGKALDGLYHLIGREQPSAVRQAAGTVLSKTKEVTAAAMEGLAGGAPGTWRDLNRLFLTSLEAISAVSAAEQLGFALGIREFVDITFPIIQEKFKHHRVLQEITLETASMAILYKKEI